MQVTDLSEIKNQEPFAKGKRGLVSVGKLRGKSVLIKRHNPEADVDTIHHEANILQIVNPHKIGPKFYGFVQGSLVREFIDGVEFVDYCMDASKEEVILVLTEILYRCRTLDLLGINKFEMVRPYKHILVVSQDSRLRKKGDVVQIDFERCRKTPTPKNVTQFCQCLVRGKLQEVYSRLGFAFDSKKLLKLAGEYKSKYSVFVFEEIVRLIGGKIRVPESFNERVWDLCSRVPEGKVVTYKDIAHALHTPAFQAIGQALKRNPYSPLVPCHRVVRTDGSIGGFMGSTQGAPIREKINLLAEESVVVVDGVVNLDKYGYSFS